MQDNDHVVQLCDPLEVMVGNDDQVVREKAIKSLRKVGQMLDLEKIKEKYLPLIKRQRKGDLFSMRIAACFLYADIYQKLDDENQTVVRKKLTKLSKDDTPMVRRGAAQSIPLVSKSLTVPHAKEFLMPIIEALL